MAVEPVPSAAESGEMKIYNHLRYHQEVESKGSHFIVAGSHKKRFLPSPSPSLCLWMLQWFQCWSRECKWWSLVVQTRDPNSLKLAVSVWCIYIFFKIAVHDIKRNHNLHRDKAQHVVNVVTAIMIYLRNYCVASLSFCDSTVDQFYLRVKFCSKVWDFFIFFFFFFFHTLSADGV